MHAKACWLAPMLPLVGRSPVGGPVALTSRCWPMRLGSTANDARGTGRLSDRSQVGLSVYGDQSVYAQLDTGCSFSGMCDRCSTLYLGWTVVLCVCLGRTGGCGAWVCLVVL